MAKALVIVDFQNDFCPGGALAVEGGDEIAGPVNELARRFDTVIATRDWHPPDHSSFETEGGPWPVHCVQDTEGAQLHPSLYQDRVDLVNDKGQDRETEGYSGFDGTKLAELLRESDVDEVAICGLTTDYCVLNTALDARKEGFDVTVVTDAIRAVDAKPGDGGRALERMRESGARLAGSSELSNQ
jgi:nicotinamidase/pyrazinamidase